MIVVSELRRFVWQLCELKEANCCATNRCGRRAVVIGRQQVQTPVFLAVEQACDNCGAMQEREAAKCP